MDELAASLSCNDGDKDARAGVNELFFVLTAEVLPENNNIDEDAEGLTLDDTTLLFDGLEEGELLSDAAPKLRDTLGLGSCAPNIYRTGEGGGKG